MPLTFEEFVLKNLGLSNLDLPELWNAYEEARRVEERASNPIAKEASEQSSIATPKQQLPVQVIEQASTSSSKHALKIEEDRYKEMLLKRRSTSLSQNSSPRSQSGSRISSPSASGSNPSSGSESDSSRSFPSLAPWKPQRTPYTPLPPRSSRNHIPEAMLLQGSKTQRTPGSPTPRDANMGYIVQQHPVDINDPVIGIWRNKLRTHVRAEIEANLPNWTSLNVVRRGISLDTTRCARTVLVGVEVGTKPKVRDQKVLEWVQRMEEWFEREAPGLGIQVEVVEEKSRRGLVIEGGAERARAKCRERGVEWMKKMGIIEDEEN